MEQNIDGRAAIATQYCSMCGRQPLCGSCAHGMWWQVGVPMHDDRWERLTAVAARTTTGRQTAATGEIRIAMCCSHCWGELDQEHINPELPLPVAPGRPIGWTTCPRCQLSYSTSRDGSRTIHHRCNNREGHRRHNARQEDANDEGGRSLPFWTTVRKANMTTPSWSPTSSSPYSFFRASLLTVILAIITLSCAVRQLSSLSNSLKHDSWTYECVMCIATAVLSVLSHAVMFTQGKSTQILYPSYPGSSVPTQWRTRTRRRQGSTKGSSGHLERNQC